MPGEPIRCPFCSDIIIAIARFSDYVRIRSFALLHLESCPKRDDWNAIEAQTIAETLIEKHLHRQSLDE